MFFHYGRIMVTVAEVRALARTLLFFLPEPSDLRFNWVSCHLARLDPEYMTELVTEAWRWSCRTSSRGSDWAANEAGARPWARPTERSGSGWSDSSAAD